MGFITNYLMGGNILQQNVKSIKGKHNNKSNFNRMRRLREGGICDDYKQSTDCKFSGANKCSWKDNKCTCEVRNTDSEDSCSCGTFKTLNECYGQRSPDGDGECTWYEELGKCNRKVLYDNNTIRDAVAAFKTESPDFKSPGAIAIYGPISRWDVSGVTNMTELFSDCNKFNEDISDWDVGNVKNMNKMFFKCNSFDQDIGSWDISGVTNMDEMFKWCREFQGLGLDKWGEKFRDITSMNFMFQGCKYIRVDLSSWNIRTCHRQEKCKNMFIDTTYDRNYPGLTQTDRAKLPNLLSG